MNTYMYKQIQENGGIPSRKQSNAESIKNDTGRDSWIWFQRTSTKGVYLQKSENLLEGGQVWLFPSSKEMQTRTA